MDELKPCPHCGGEAEEIHSSTNGLLSPRIAFYYVRCKACKATGPVDRVPQKADEAWNRRAAPENKPLTLRELGELAEADETVYEANGREWDLYSHYPEIRAKSENCNIVVDASKIAGGFFLYARKPEGSTT